LVRSSFASRLRVGLRRSRRGGGLQQRDRAQLRTAGTTAKQWMRSSQLNVAH